MLLSTALAAALSSAPLPQERAQATVRIARAVRVNKDEWDRSARKREIEIIENGQPLRIRLVEFE